MVDQDTNKYGPDQVDQNSNYVPNPDDSALTVEAPITPTERKRIFAEGYRRGLETRIEPGLDSNIMRRVGTRFSSLFPRPVQVPQGYCLVMYGWAGKKPTRMAEVKHAGLRWVWGGKGLFASAVPVSLKSDIIDLYAQNVDTSDLIDLNIDAAMYFRVKGMDDGEELEPVKAVVSQSNYLRNLGYLGRTYLFERFAGKSLLEAVKMMGERISNIDPTHFEGMGVEVKYMGITDMDIPERHEQKLAELAQSIVAVAAATNYKAAATALGMDPERYFTLLVNREIGTSGTNTILMDLSNIAKSPAFAEVVKKSSVIGVS